MRAFAALAVALVLPGVAGAAILDLTQSTLAIRIAELPALSVTQSPDPTPISVSSGAGSFVLPAGLFASTVFTAVSTAGSLIETLALTVDNQTAAFTGAGGQDGGFGGVGPLTGVFRIGFLAGLINLSIPLSVVGVGGVVRTGAAALLITVTGHHWTTGRVVTTTLVGYDAISGYDNRTAGHAGALQLVTPFRIDSNAFGGSLRGVGTLTLRFVPQPDVLLLGLSAAAGLAVVGRRRQRRSAAHVLASRR
ncbi:MAG: hypothetical protein O7G30_11160 [Proteobacteria bacterium]|nr:hypothetical protein [Pseudomonadota bacterium]